MSHVTEFELIGVWWCPQAPIRKEFQSGHKTKPRLLPRRKTEKHRLRPNPTYKKWGHFYRREGRVRTQARDGSLLISVRVRKATRKS